MISHNLIHFEIFDNPCCATPWGKHLRPGIAGIYRGVLSQKQVSRAGTSNYIPRYLWDVITYPYPWYLLLAYHIILNTKTSIATTLTTSEVTKATITATGHNATVRFVTFCSVFIGEFTHVHQGYFIGTRVIMQLLQRHEAYLKYMGINPQGFLYRHIYYMHVYDIIYIIYIC